MFSSSSTSLVMEKEFVEVAPGPEHFDLVARHIRAVGREEKFGDLARETGFGKNLRQIIDEMRAAQGLNPPDLFPTRRFEEDVVRRKPAAISSKKFLRS